MDKRTLAIALAVVLLVAGVGVASGQNSRFPGLENLADRVDDLEARVSALESQPTPTETPSSTPTPTATPTPTPTPTPSPTPTPTPSPTPTPTPTATEPEPTPTSTESAPSSWQQAWDTRDYDTIRGWYRANTGIAAAGLTDSDLDPSSSITTSRDGQVIQGVLVSGSISIVHDNVTVRNTKVVNNGGSIAINVPWGARDVVNTFHLENVTVVGTGEASEFRQAIGGTYAYPDGLHATRVQINGFGGGFRLSAHGDDTVDLSMVENIRIHPGSHNTGLSFRGGTGKIVTRSWIEGSTSSALSMYPDASPVHDFVASQNLFDGGSYSVLGGDEKTFGDETTASFTDNLFTRDHVFGPLANFDRSLPGRVWTGNAYLDGTPID